MSKLKYIKGKILKWNKEHFGNIFKEKAENEEELTNLNKEVIKNGMNNNTYYREKELLAKQESILAKEEIFWHQKSREKWLNKGDQNTKFFYNSMISKRSLERITKIKDPNGTLTKNSKTITETIVNHFQNLLNNLEGSNK